MLKYFSILILFELISCSNKQDNNLPYINEPITENPKEGPSAPVIKTKYKGTEYPWFFEAAFDTSTYAIQDDMFYSFETKNIGLISITSGKIIACDPITMSDAKPFSYTFPLGKFPVEFGITKVPENQRVAFSRIIFSIDSVKKWIYAVQDDEKEIPINDTSFFCYGVDGGTGIFIDEEANNIFKQKTNSEWNKVFMNGKWFQPGYYGQIYSFDGKDLAAFSTGYGDGCYATYIGLDKNNNVCRLLTDFGLVAWWKIKKK